MSSSDVPNGATVLWIKNLSLQCISRGADLWACMVTSLNKEMSNKHYVNILGNEKYVQFGPNFITLSNIPEQLAYIKENKWCM